jgi:AcrR family transcriptional regulator
LRASAQDQRKELDKQRRQVDFDTYDVTVDELLRRVEKGRIDVAPAYQRKFRWDKPRQSALVESIFLGIPVPPLFMATNASAGKPNSWEVVDGLQRVTTLVNFAGNDLAREKIGLDGTPLKLEELDKLQTFEGYSFNRLPDDLRTLFEDRPLKVVVLNDKSDRRVRFDLFERINTGGIKLSHQEVRECVFRGPFIELLEELAQRDDFNTLIHLSLNNQDDGTREEFALRFFAYLEKYEQFEHAVKEFLDEFTIASLKEPDVKRREREFDRTFSYLARCFPDGLKSRKGVTPVNMFEGVAVGAALALRENPKLRVPKDLSWVHGAEFREFISGATNTRARVRGRVEYCRDKFLEA